MDSTSESGIDELGLLPSRRLARGRCWKFCAGLLPLLRSWWKTIVILSTPVLLLPLPLTIGDPAASAAYVIFIIAVYWTSEALPLVVTSLLPLVLFPALGVLTASQVGVAYLNDTNWLFAGGLMVAIAVEKWNLHKRLALLVLLLMGSRPSMLLLGFMGSTAFLSMWLSNTATSAMMLPIAQAVLTEFEKCSEEVVASTDRSSLRDHPTGRTGSVVGVGYRKLGIESGIGGEDIVPSGGDDDDDGDGGGGGDRNERTEHDDDLRADEYSDRSDKEVELSTERVNELASLSPLEETQADRSVAGASHSYNSISQRKAEDDCKEAKGEKVIKTGTVKRLGKGLMIGVAYAANIGGMATLTGTGPNLVLRGVVQSLFPQSAGINFGVWFVFGVPTAFLALAGTWLYLTLLFCDDSFLRIKKKLCYKWTFDILDAKKGREVVRAQYRLLGSIKYAEVVVLLLFVLLALLWFLRDPKFMPGWGALFPSDQNGTSYVSDSSAAIFIVVLLFIIPSKPCLLCRKCRKGSSSRQICIDTGRSERLLDWPSIHHKLPWNVILLLGSGFAMAKAAQCSGLSAWIGSSLHGLSALSPSAVAFMVTIIVAAVTQVISNVATTTLFLPILAQLGVSLGINPLYLMIPATVAASLAFVLPVSTPPNAIAFSYGYIRVVDMVLTGIPVNLFCIAVLTFAVNTYGSALFSLHTLPQWSAASNITANATSC